MNTLFRIIYLIFFSAFVFGIAFAATFVDDTQSEFDFGTYSNTAWDTNHVELSSGQTSGTFTSQVFDGGSADTVSWSEIAWSETLTSVDKLILVDSNADVFKSVDDGANWSLVKDDYTGADANNATDMVQDGNENIFILFNQDIWKSTDVGVSWTKVNDDYNGGEGQNGLRIAVDGSNNLYVVEADEEVWQSTDSGANWIKVGVTGSVNVAGFVGVGSTLFLVDISADLWSSTDSGVNWSLIKDDYTGADANNADYMVADSGGNLVILFNQDVWRSTDSGVNWTKVNDDYNGAESQSGLLLARNSSNELFIVEGDDDIWQSTDNGTNWTKLGNFGGGTVSGLVFVGVSTDITFSARSGSTNPPTDSFSGALTDPSGEDPNVSNARYFQYRATFTSEDSGVTPELSSVTATYSVSDTTAPMAVSDLALSNAQSNSIDVSWIAPGDDGSSGTATSYDLRYSTPEITAGNFLSATQATGKPAPSVAGSSESMTVSGLSAETTYYFALKTSDEVPNTSALSNVPSLATLSGTNSSSSSSGSRRRGSIVLFNPFQTPVLPVVPFLGLPDTGSKDITRTEAINTFHRLLRFGARGADVVALQTALRRVGISPGAVDGLFGPITRAAVVQYQASVGLSPDGIFGPLTTAKLISNLGE